MPSPLFPSHFVPSIPRIGQNKNKQTTEERKNRPETNGNAREHCDNGFCRSSSYCVLVFRTFSHSIQSIFFSFPAHFCRYTLVDEFVCSSHEWPIVRRRSSLIFSFWFLLSPAAFVRRSDNGHTHARSNSTTTAIAIDGSSIIVFATSYQIHHTFGPESLHLADARW